MNSIRHYISEHRKRLAAFFTLTLVFFLTRFFFWHLGVRFDTSPLAWFWQYLDVDVLQNRLLPGLINLHSQPPAFNLFLGLVIRFCPNPSLCFHFIYMLMGLALYTSMFAFLRLSRFSWSASFLFATAFIISPGTIMYENWLFYTYPVAVLLMLATLSLRHFEENLSPVSAVIFLFVLVLVCLTRSLFHLFYLVVAVTFVLAVKSRRRKAIGLWAIAAVSMVLLVLVKNWLMFGCFTTSSWGGMNIAKMARQSIGAEEIARMVAAGDLPGLAGIAPFQFLDVYPKNLRPHADSDSGNVPELYSPTKASGHQNFNHLDYITIAREYSLLAMQMIKMRPRYYLSGVFEAWLTYSEPGWNYIFLRANREVLADYISFLSIFRQRGWVDIQPVKSIIRGESGQPIYFPLSSLTILFILFLAAVIAMRMLVRACSSDYRAPLSYLFMTYSVLYVAFIGNTFELGENNRFRVMTDPLIFMLAILSCRMLLAKIRQKLE